MKLSLLAGAVALAFGLAACDSGGDRSKSASSPGASSSSIGIFAEQHFAVVAFRRQRLGCPAPLPPGPAGRLPATHRSRARRRAARAARRAAPAARSRALRRAVRALAQQQLPELAELELLEQQHAVFERGRHLGFVRGRHEQQPGPQQPGPQLQLLVHVVGPGREEGPGREKVVSPARATMGSGESLAPFRFYDTFTCIEPMRSIFASMVSPGLTGPTPCGVPVRMTSPGCNV